MLEFGGRVWDHAGFCWRSAVGSPPRWVFFVRFHSNVAVLRFGFLGVHSEYSMNTGFSMCAKRPGFASWRARVFFFRSLFWFCPQRGPKQNQSESKQNQRKSKPSQSESKQNQSDASSKSRPRTRNSCGDSKISSDDKPKPRALNTTHTHAKTPSERETLRERERA